MSVVLPSFDLNSAKNAHVKTKNEYENSAYIPSKYGQYTDSNY